MSSLRTQLIRTLLTRRFILVFEPFLCQHYQSPLIWRVLRHGTRMVPVVFGGVEYSRLLPDYSYIDALNQVRPIDRLRESIARSPNQFLVRPSAIFPPSWPASCYRFCPSSSIPFAPLIVPSGSPDPSARPTARHWSGA